MAFAARPVTGADVVPLENITVHPEQDRFIAPNIVTIAQARFETGAYDFCLWDGDTRVGLIALIDMAEHDDREEIDDPEAVYVWRLLIGKDFQRRGHGKAAMDFAEDWARKRSRRCVQIQAVEDNVAAIAMYQALGYTLTGHKSGKEVQLEKVL
ncbi:GNAT family N-acetyltransferase [Cognatiyoonia sp. IB215182]|uniref:GNAT family N-acetyltransferase n=1 Tax=Cognatiyoonia sp. IB215182 TaxID=3097353 RepID=UPI002A14FBBF|nr:GNAT family N-acetyltransferase [Cognatiyoonia sp. IB215182]MDX8353123.1 GNAT family N-acetyltransferase [Cognatiyoonia sp. IB215182]